MLSEVRLQGNTFLCIQINVRETSLILIFLISTTVSFACIDGTCGDGSTSVKSKIKDGCGQEAITNVIRMYCNSKITPDEVNIGMRTVQQKIMQVKMQ